MTTDIVVEKVRDGQRAAIRIPYEVRGDEIVIDHMTLVGAVAMLNEAIPPRKVGA